MICQIVYIADYCSTYLNVYLKIVGLFLLIITTAQALGQAGNSSIKSAGMDFWSFQPIQRSKLPMVKNQSWIQSPIDNFVLAKLESVGLQPAIPASKRMLLRRLTVNL
ncbi:MAG: hypothetical protein VX409_07550, partial [Verrucomicrobiota bacterium]|nr:hypothetical protein [Verrucomicrobiota bacterium]